MNDEHPASWLLGYAALVIASAWLSAYVVAPAVWIWWMGGW